MMRVVQQDQFLAELAARGLKDAGDVAQVSPGIPGLDLGRGATRRGLVLLAPLGRYSVRRRNTWDSRLQPDSSVTVLAMLVHRIEQFRNVPPGCVGVDKTAGTASSTEQLIDRQTSRLPFDIP